MLNELYVDDLINSSSGTTEALQLSEEMIPILGVAGINCRRWATNSTTLHEAWKQRANIDCRKTLEESGVPLKDTWNNMGQYVNGNLNLDIRPFEKLNNFMKADICHSYQILKNHGIPDERTDDIANNGEHLTPGIVINAPNENCVYKGDS
ncbi:UNVERIFIED_CONTAM: Lgmn [Trichonephila clavipes]